MIEHGCGIAGLQRFDGIDLILTDPPYPEHLYAGSRSQSRAGPVLRRDLGHGPIREDFRSALARAIAARARRWVIIFAALEDVGNWRFALQVQGLEYVRTGVWYKPNGAPQFSGDRPAHAHEAICFAHVVGPKRWHGGGRRAHWNCPRPVARSGETLHPTEKPVALLRELVRLFSEPGDLVVDPCAGRGSTIVAARLEGRKAAGWEVDREMAGRASQRLPTEDRPHGSRELDSPPRRA